MSTKLDTKTLVSSAQRLAADIGRINEKITTLKDKREEIRHTPRPAADVIEKWRGIIQRGAANYEKRFEHRLGNTARVNASGTDELLFDNIGPAQIFDHGAMFYFFGDAILEKVVAKVQEKITGGLSDADRETKLAELTAEIEQAELDRLEIASALEAGAGEVRAILHQTRVSVTEFDAAGKPV